MYRVCFLSKRFCSFSQMPHLDSCYSSSFAMLRIGLGDRSPITIIYFLYCQTLVMILERSLIGSSYYSRFCSVKNCSENFKFETLRISSQDDIFTRIENLSETQSNTNINKPIILTNENFLTRFDFISIPR